MTPALLTTAPGGTGRLQRKEGYHMKLKMVITFDPFEVSAPELRVKVLEAGVKSEQITTHPAREAAPSKSKKAGKPEAVRS